MKHWLLKSFSVTFKEHKISLTVTSTWQLGLGQHLEKLLSEILYHSNGALTTLQGFSVLRLYHRAERIHVLPSIALEQKVNHLAVNFE
jgi:hypothetical protein